MLRLFAFALFCAVGGNRTIINDVMNMMYHGRDAAECLSYRKYQRLIEITGITYKSKSETLEPYSSVLYEQHDGTRVVMTYKVLNEYAPFGNHGTGRPYYDRCIERIRDKFPSYNSLKYTEPSKFTMDDMLCVYDWVNRLFNEMHLQ